MQAAVFNAVYSFSSHARERTLVWLDIRHPAQAPYSGSKISTCVQSATLVLALGRRYGLVGRNGTGKTTFLRALASKSIKGIPDNVQVSPDPHRVVCGDLDSENRDCGHL